MTQEFGNMLGEHPSTIETALKQAQLSLKPVPALVTVRTVRDLKASRPDLKFYVMSNISRASLAIPISSISSKEDSLTNM